MLAWSASRKRNTLPAGPRGAVVVRGACLARAAIWRTAVRHVEGVGTMDHVVALVEFAFPHLVYLPQNVVGPRGYHRDGPRVKSVSSVSDSRWIP